MDGTAGTSLIRSLIFRTSAEESKSASHELMPQLYTNFGDDLVDFTLREYAKFCPRRQCALGMYLEKWQCFVPVTQESKRGCPLRNPSSILFEFSNMSDRGIPLEAPAKPPASRKRQRVYAQWC